MQPGVKKGKFGGTATATLKEKVDFAVFDISHGKKAMFLVEGKTPRVLRGLAGVFDGNPITIDILDQSGSGRRVLNKVC